MATKMMLILAVAAMAFALVGQAMAQGKTPQEILKYKDSQLRKAAANAVNQQRLESYPAQKLKAEFSGAGNVKVEESSDWDADGDGKCLKVTLTDIPMNHNHKGIADRLEIRFGGPVDLLEKSTGMAFWIKTPEDFPGDVRFGAYFKVQGAEGEDPVVISDTPVRHKFGDNPHQAYIDWGYAFDHTVGVFKVPPRDYFTRVTGVDLTFVQKRLPIEKGLRLEPASAVFYIDGLELVDFYHGSYDSDRFPKGKPINAKHPIVAQGRTQQVSRICAEYGDEAGMKSAIAALDMMARTQCWDGSWSEMQTRLQGEWTHGMILADLSWALKAMRDQERPELKETITIRHMTMPRDQLYEQMLYRGARSRSPSPIHTWRDTYASGGALLSGANRPMIFVVSQYIAAQQMTDAQKKEQILAEYDENLDDLVAHQGVTAGGWPIFGEGDKFGGKGLRWDCGYTTDHVFIMSIGSRVTGDERWGQMMRKFGTVVEAMVLPSGTYIDGGLSERGNAKQGGIKAPDMVYQEAVRWNAKELAQWAANASQATWAKNGQGTLWPSCSSFKGYALGAFLTWQVYDQQADPWPTDLGHVFPRQWPIWTAKWMDKEGKQARQSKIFLRPGGQIANTFEWEVGQYPVLSAIPVMLSAEGGAVEIEPVAYVGDVRKVADDARIKVLTGDPASEVDGAADGRKFQLTISEPTVVVLMNEAAEVEVRFIATPRGKEPVTLKGELLREPVEYDHQYIKEEAANVDLSKAGINVAAPATGTVLKPVDCFPNAEYGIERAFDGNAGTAWVIGQYKPGAKLTFEFANEAKLDKLVLAQGDWQNTFHLVKKLTATFSDGSKKTFDLEKKPNETVEFDLGGVTSKSLTLTVDEIYEREGNGGNVGGWSNLRILTGAK